MGNDDNDESVTLNAKHGGTKIGSVRNAVKNDIHYGFESESRTTRKRRTMKQKDPGRVLTSSGMEKALEGA